MAADSQLATPTDHDEQSAARRAAHRTAHDRDAAAIVPAAHPGTAGVTQRAEGALAEMTARGKQCAATITASVHSGNDDGGPIALPGRAARLRAGKSASPIEEGNRAHAKGRVPRDDRRARPGGCRTPRRGCPPA